MVEVDTRTTQDSSDYIEASKERHYPMITFALLGKVAAYSVLAVCGVEVLAACANTVTTSAGGSYVQESGQPAPSPLSSSLGYQIPSELEIDNQPGSHNGYNTTSLGAPGSTYEVTDSTGLAATFALENVSGSLKDFKLVSLTGGSFDVRGVKEQVGFSVSGPNGGYIGTLGTGAGAINIYIGEPSQGSQIVDTAALAQANQDGISAAWIGATTSGQNGQEGH